MRPFFPNLESEPFLWFGCLRAQDTLARCSQNSAIRATPARTRSVCATQLKRSQPSIDLPNAMPGIATTSNRSINSTAAASEVIPSGNRTQT